jgi:hypothetical protein
MESWKAMSKKVNKLKADYGGLRGDNKQKLDYEFLIASWEQ